MTRHLTVTLRYSCLWRVLALCCRGDLITRHLHADVGGGRSPYGPSSISRSCCRSACQGASTIHPSGRRRMLRMHPTPSQAADQRHHRRGRPQRRVQAWSSSRATSREATLLPSVLGGYPHVGRWRAGARRGRRQGSAEGESTSGSIEMSRPGGSVVCL